MLSVVTVIFVRVTEHQLHRLCGIVCKHDWMIFMTSTHEY